MTRPNYALLASNFVLLAIVIGLFVSDRWVAGLALVAITLPAIVYWQVSPPGRARRRANAPIVWDVNPLAIGSVLLIIGLGVLVLLVGGVVSGEGARPVIAAGPLAIGCLLLAFRFLTAARLQRALTESLAGSPVLVGTGDSRSSRLRAMGLEAGRLVTAEASAFGKPLTFSHIPLQDISAIEEPGLGSVRVNTKNGESFWVQRGSPSAARRLTRELDRWREATT